MELEILQRKATTEKSKGNILFRHGACMGAWCWTDNLLPWFANQGYDTFALSLRNHGKSPNRGSTTFRTIKEYVQDLSDTLANIPGEVHVVGHSMGGFVLQHYLKNPGNKVGKGILLCSAASHGAGTLVKKLVQDFPIGFLKSNLTLSWLPILADKRHARKVMFRQDITDVRMDAILSNMKDESFLVFLELFFMNLPDPKKVNKPIMVIGAEKDYLIPEKDTRKMAAAYGVDPFIIPEASHNFFLEDEWEYVAENMLAFLEK